MNRNLHTLRATAPFPAKWRLLPLVIAGVAAVAACFVQALADHLMQGDAVVEAQPRPARAGADADAA